MKLSGPYKVENKKIIFTGSSLYKKNSNITNVVAPDLSSSYSDKKRNTALISLYNIVFQEVGNFMKLRNAQVFDLPITTRMISSPGALNGKIISDVDPFAIKFFDKDMYLTQSSQLYLELALVNSKHKELWCWDKSFRRERADFRHLPEFTHIEYEAEIDFEKNILLQQDFLKYLINKLIAHKDFLKVFIDKEAISLLADIGKLKEFPRIKFYDAFDILYKKTKDKKYKKPSITNFTAYEEILLTEHFGNKPVFVTHYIADEVAFYHANDKDDENLAINSDLLFPGFGELIGGGQRVKTHKEILSKAKHFGLNLDDYKAYINSRKTSNDTIHSGWGMGIERFLQSALRLPYIWEAKVFARVDNSNKP